MIYFNSESSALDSSSYTEIRSIQDSGDCEEGVKQGNHLPVLDYLERGGLLSDRSSSYPSLAWVCFKYLSVSQIKEILASLPEGAELPSDCFFALTGDENWEKAEELLPELEKFDYPFDFVFELELCKGHLDGVEFFLHRIPKGLDLNDPVSNDFHMKIHPYLELKMQSGRMAFLTPFLEHINKGKDSDFEKVAKEAVQIQKLIQQMENHSGVDLNRAREEEKKLRSQGIYFEGDAGWERDRQFLMDAASYPGLEKQVASGFNLYEPIGSCCFYLAPGIDGTVSWIELLCFFYGYEEYELVDLMENYRIVS